MEDKKIFDFEHVACEDCERYWDSSCDGHKKEAPCKSFKAALKYDIPKRLKNAEDTIKSLSADSWISFILEGLIVVYIIIDGIKGVLA